MLGDVIDRREGGVELLQWMMRQPNVELLLGNHEAMMLACAFLFSEVTEELLEELTPDHLEMAQNWAGNGSEPTLAALRRLSPEERQDLLDYVSDAPRYEMVEAGGKDFLLNHAGWGNYRPGKKLREYTDDEVLWNRPALTDEYYPETISIFGHTPADYYGEAYAGRMLQTKSWIDIDTGETPMLLRLDDLTPFYPE